MLIFFLTIINLVTVVINPIQACLIACIRVEMEIVRRIVTRRDLLYERKKTYEKVIAVLVLLETIIFKSEISFS